MLVVSARLTPLEFHTRASLDCNCGNLLDEPTPFCTSLNKRIEPFENFLDCDGIKDELVVCMLQIIFFGPLVFYFRVNDFQSDG